MSNTVTNDLIFLTGVRPVRSCRDQPHNGMILRDKNQKHRLPVRALAESFFLNIV